MARGKKKEVTAVEDKGSLKLIKYNPKIIEDNNKSPKYQLDDYVGVAYDNDQYELVKIKQVTVAESNIKTTTNTYGDKYSIGDKFQEWTTLGKYLNTYERAVEVYADMKFANEYSKLEYCKDMSVLVKLKNDIHDSIKEYMIADTVPQITRQVSESIKELEALKAEMKSLQKLKLDVEKSCNDILSANKSKWAEIATSGVLGKKENKYKTPKDEVED